MGANFKHFSVVFSPSPVLFSLAVSSSASAFLMQRGRAAEALARTATSSAEADKKALCSLTVLLLLFADGLQDLSPILRDVMTCVSIFPVAT